MLDRWEQTERGFTVFAYALAASGLLNASAMSNYALFNTVFGSGAAGQDPGMVSRADGYAERSTSPEIAVRYLDCQAAGWRGGALQQCAVRWRSRVLGAVMVASH